MIDRDRFFVTHKQREDLASIEQLEPLHQDPRSWFLGAVSPSVRRAVARTKDGHLLPRSATPRLPSIRSAVGEHRMRSFNRCC